MLVHDFDIDTDLDGTHDGLDSDDDGDGTDDVDDAFPLNSSEDTDTDMDGIGDNSDADDDSDGVNDTDDDFPLDASEDTDTDMDGIGNNADIDDDNDGVNDTDEETLDCALIADCDADGYTDDVDLFDTDSSEWNDTDGDGTGDNSDWNASDENESADSDGDGIGDNEDVFPLDENETIDTDGDGYGDNSDAFPDDSSEWSDTDSDGTGDNSDAFIEDDCADTDTDGDGAPDSVCAAGDFNGGWTDDSGTGISNLTLDIGGGPTVTLGEEFSTSSNLTTCESSLTFHSYDEALGWVLVDHTGLCVGENGTQGSNGTYTYEVNDTISCGAACDGFDNFRATLVGNGTGTSVAHIGLAASQPADTDDDNDGVLGADEVAGCDTLADCDGDGVGDATDDFVLDTNASVDTDGDGDADEIITSGAVFSFDFEDGMMPDAVTWEQSQCVGYDVPGWREWCEESTSQGEWFVDSVSDVNGTESDYALRSGELTTNYANSNISMTFTSAAGTFSFDYALSVFCRTTTSNFYDGLRVYVDGVLIENPSDGGTACANGVWGGDNGTTTTTSFDTSHPAYGADVGYFICQDGSYGFSWSLSQVGLWTITRLR